MPLQAAIDDSGGKGQGRTFVLAGWVAEAEEWADFGSEWTAALRAPPSIDHFSFHEASTLGGRFGRFHAKQRDSRVRSLARILHRRAYPAFRCALDLHAFPETYGEAGKPFSDPYFWPFHICIMGISIDLVDLGHRERIDVIFDNNVIFGPRAVAFYPLMRALLMRPEDRLVMPEMPVFRDDKEFLPLQAADFLAGLIRSWRDGNREFDWLSEEIGDVALLPSSRALDKNLMRRYLDPADKELREAYEREFGDPGEWSEEQKRTAAEFQDFVRQLDRKPRRTRRKSG